VHRKNIISSRRHGENKKTSRWFALMNADQKRKKQEAAMNAKYANHWNLIRVHSRKFAAKFLIRVYLRKSAANCFSPW